MIDRPPDVEAYFEFNGTRKSPLYDGYRPQHFINDQYLSSGMHHYFDVACVPPDGTAHGTITLLSLEEYPACMWPGRRINVQEGARIVGYATITKVLHPLLALDGANILLMSIQGEYGRAPMRECVELWAEIRYLAVCQDAGRDTVRLLLCDGDVDVVNSLDFPTIDAAMRNAQGRTSEKIRWTDRTA